MKKILRLVLYLITLMALLSNMFIFDFPNGFYYIFNSIVFTKFILISFLLHKNIESMSNTEKKVFKIIFVFSLVSLLSQFGSYFILKPYNFRDLSILVFSIINLIAFFIVIFKYEFKS